MREDGGRCHGPGGESASWSAFRQCETRPVVVDGCEHSANKDAVPSEVAVRPRHELLANLDVGGREVRGPNPRSEEDEVLGSAEDWILDDCDLEWGVGRCNYPLRLRS